jgi:cytochrome c oxidase subunit II
MARGAVSLRSGSDAVASDRRKQSLKRHAIVFLLAIGATSAAVWARQLAGGSDVKIIDVTASRFQFEPATISVGQGDNVRLRLHSADRSHAFAIKAFHVKAVIPDGGETVTVEFVADQAGTFAFTCSEYCGTGHSRMKGKLVVKAAGK